jgi:uncharacterized protein YerC
MKSTLRKSFLSILKKPEIRMIRHRGKEIRISSDGKHVWLDDDKRKIRQVKFPNNGNPVLTNVIYVTLDNGTRTFFTIKKLVALAFIPNTDPKSKPFILYLNPDDRLNDGVSNLIWGNRSDIYKIKLGANKVSFYNDSTCYSASKIKIEDFWKIAKRLDSGETASSIAKEYGTSEMSIIRIKQKHCRKPSTNPVFSQVYKEEVILGLASFLEENPERSSIVRYAQLNNISYHLLYRWRKRIDRICNIS